MYLIYLIKLVCCFKLICERTGQPLEVYIMRGENACIVIIISVIYYYCTEPELFTILIILWLRHTLLNDTNL